MAEWQITITKDHSTKLVSTMGKWAIMGIKNLDGSGLTQIYATLEGMQFTKIKEELPTVISPTQALAIEFIRSRVRKAVNETNN